MKRFTKTMKMVAAMLSLCIVCALSVSVEAAEAKYQPGVTYVNPAINSKNEYYSVNKLRMSTYSDQTIQIVYPKDGTISVSTSKKALEAMITSRSNEYITGETGKKVYVQPTKQSLWDSYNYETLYYDAATGRFYYEEYVYDYETYTGGYEKVYPESFSCYIYTSEDYSSRYYVTYEATTNSYYYYTYDDNDDEVKTYLTLDKIAWDCYYTNDAGNTYYLTKDNAGYYYRDSSITVYENSQTVTYDDGVTPDYEYAYANIQLTSTQKGTYKVNVTVNGVKHTITVYVTPYGGDIYTSAKLGKSTIYKWTLKENASGYTSSSISDYQVKSSVKSDKLKLTSDKGIKITGIITASLDKNGKVVYKKGKNGSKINLSQAYAVDNRNSYYGNKTKSETKNTYVFVSYTDKYLGTSVKYSIVNKHGVKQIKQEYKGMDKKKYVRYYDYGDYGRCTIGLWSY